MTPEQIAKMEERAFSYLEARHNPLRNEGKAAMLDYINGYIATLESEEVNAFVDALKFYTSHLSGKTTLGKSGWMPKLLKDEGFTATSALNKFYGREDE